MRILKKAILIGSVLLFFVSTIVFIVLFIIKNNETLKLQQEVGTLSTQLQVASNSNSNDDDADLQCEDGCDQMRTFKDEGLNIELEYPATWTEELNSEITTEFVYDPIHGVVTTGYTLTLKKGVAELTFEKLLAAVDGFPSGLEDGTEYVELAPNLLRMRGVGDTWSYVSKLDCSDYTGEPFDLSEFDVCIGAFFPGFGDTFANNVSINSNNAAILEEADQIAISALN